MQLPPVSSFARLASLMPVLLPPYGAFSISLWPPIFPCSASYVEQPSTRSGKIVPIFVTLVSSFSRCLFSRSLLLNSRIVSVVFYEAFYQTALFPILNDVLCYTKNRKRDTPYTFRCRRPGPAVDSMHACNVPCVCLCVCAYVCLRTCMCVFPMLRRATAAIPPEPTSFCSVLLFFFLYCFSCTFDCCLP